jgi:hypothetical protein
VDNANYLDLLSSVFSLVNCGCSSVVEHLLAKEDVASSSLVTRSGPESFRGWSEAEAAQEKIRSQHGYFRRSQMVYVYILAREPDRSKYYYTGITSDLHQQLGQHNRGEFAHTPVPGESRRRSHFDRGGTLWHLRNI